MAQRVIIHGDMDAFFASVEQLDRNLWGKPVIVGSAPDQRGVVSAASYEARKFGVHSAMPSRTAYKLCPDGIFLPGRMERYKEISAQIMETFHSFTPFIQPLSVDEAFLDVTGSLRHFGSAREMAERIKKDVREKTGLTVSVGVGPNKFLAKLASDMDKPNGLTITPFEQDEITKFLAPIPIRKMWGVGRKTGERLSLLGIKTVADIQSFDLQTLINILGNAPATTLKRLAFGIDDRPLETSVKEKSVSNETTFKEDCYDKQVVLTMLKRLAEKVAWRLRKSGEKGKTLRVKVRYADFSTFSRQLSLSEPSDVTAVFIEKAFQLCKSMQIENGVRLVGFGVAGLDGGVEPAQLSFDFEESDKADVESEQELDKTLDYISEKFGHNIVRRGLK